MFVAALLALAWAGIVGIALWNARVDALAGLQELESVDTTMDLRTLEPGDAADHLQAAAVHFDAAARRTGRPWIRILGPVPALGTQVRSVHALAVASRDVSTASATLAGTAVGLREELDAGTVSRGDLVGRLADATSAALPAFDRDLGPRQGLLRPLAAAHIRLRDERATLRSQLATVDAAAQGLSSFFDGRQYLILAANPSEMRVGSGAVLQTAAFSTAKDGSLAFDASSTVSGDVPVRWPLVTDADLQRNWGFLFPNRSWQNLALSARFPVVARQAAALAAARTPEGPPPDGVVLVDQVALRELLTLTGPVEIGGQTFTGDNVQTVIGNTQYALFDRTQDGRRELLAALAAVVAQRVANDTTDPFALLDAFRRAANGRHLLLWSSDATQQAGWRALGVDGEVGERDLQVALSNHGANKLDYFTTIVASIVGAPAAAPDGPVDVTLSLRVTNAVPAGQPSYVLGEVDNGGAGRYYGFLTLTLPGAVGELRVDELDGGAALGPTPGPDEQQAIFGERDVDRVVVNGRDGANRVVSVAVGIDPGQTLVRTFRFTLPADIARSVRVLPSARWPQVRWDSGGVTDAAPTSIALAP